MEQKNKIFDKYLIIRNEVDKFAGKLEKIHHKNINCKKGCDSCCMDYSIFPVEFSFILNELKNKGFRFEQTENQKENGCVFLKNHTCTIYENRPVICRTHGLPLIYANDDG